MARLLSIAAGVHPMLPPEEMVSAAAAAGWPACGIWFDGTTWTDSTTREVKRRLDDTGIVALDIEPIIPSDGGDDFAEKLIDAAAALGIGNILYTSRLKDQASTTARYAECCDMALPHGIRVVCEFLPIFPLNSLPMAKDIVAAANRPNGGILIDNLHLSRSGGSVADVADVDRALMPYIQIADAPLARPDSFEALLDEAINGRLCPDEGGLPIAELLATVPDVPISFEVRSKFLRENFTDPVERARHLLKMSSHLA